MKTLNLLLLSILLMSCASTSTETEKVKDKKNNFPQIWSYGGVRDLR